MTSKEKLVLLKEILDLHYELFGFLSQAEMKGYFECIQMFLRTDDPIMEEAGLATCQLFIQNGRQRRAVDE